MYKPFLSAVLKERGWDGANCITEMISSPDHDEDCVLFRWKSTPDRINKLLETMYCSAKATDRVKKLIFRAGLKKGKLSLSLEPTDSGSLECDFNVDPLRGPSDVSEDADYAVGGLAWEIYHHGKATCSELLRVRHLLAKNNEEVDDKIIWTFRTKKYHVQLMSVVDQNPDLLFDDPVVWSDVEKLLAPDGLYQYLGLVCTVSYMHGNRVLPITKSKQWDIICLKTDKTYQGKRKNVIKQALCDARAIIMNRGL